MSTDTIDAELARAFGMDRPWPVRMLDHARIWFLNARPWAVAYHVRYALGRDIKADDVRAGQLVAIPVTDRHGREHMRFVGVNRVRLNEVDAYGEYGPRTDVWVKADRFGNEWLDLGRAGDKVRALWPLFRRQR